jgi:hypothetical protein
MCWRKSFQREGNAMHLNERPPGQLSSSFFECLQTVFDENSLVAVFHSPYSSILAQSNVWRIWHIKAFLADRVLNDVNELLGQSSSFK